VISDGGKKVALVSDDLLLILTDLKDEVSKNVANLKLDGIMLASTHTHSGPGGYSDIWIVKIAVLGPYVPEYREYLVKQISAAIREADKNLQPAKFGSAVFQAPGYGHNRRHPELDAITDPALGLIRITDLFGKPLATLVNYAAHATVLGPDNMKISGDYVGVMERTLEEKEPGALAMFFAGPIGDQGPNCQPAEKGLECMNRLGTGLAGEVMNDLPKIALTDSVKITLMDQQVPMPALELRKGCWRGLGWIMKSAGKKMAREKGEFMALELNDTLIYGVGAEAAVGLGFELKAQHPDKKVMVFAHANDWQGYLLTPAEYDFGGYEACMSLYGREFEPYLVKQYGELTSAVK
jgi:hypothetical protein